MYGICFGSIFLSLYGACLFTTCDNFVLKFSYSVLMLAFVSMSQFTSSKSVKNTPWSKFLKLLHFLYFGLLFGRSHLIWIPIILCTSLKPQLKLQSLPHLFAWLVKITSTRLGLKFLVKQVAFLTKFFKQKISKQSWNMLLLLLSSMLKFMSPIIIKLSYFFVILSQVRLKSSRNLLSLIFGGL